MPEPEAVTAVLGIVYRAISTHLIRKAGRTQATAQSGAVTLIQRFGSALNLNIHFHLLVLDGVYGRVNSHLTLDREGTALDSLLSHSITYRIALGPRAGQKAFTLQSLPGTSRREPDEPFLASADGFSLHAGVAAGADERKKSALNAAVSHGPRLMDATSYPLKTVGCCIDRLRAPGVE